MSIKAYEYCLYENQHTTEKLHWVLNRNWKSFFEVQTILKHIEN